MKVITLIQPWATLIALGEKKFETRSWKTKYRGELGIHAGKKVDKAICQLEPFRSVLAKHGYTAEGLPAGAIIATTRLADCFEVMKENEDCAVLGNGADIVCGNEFIFGDYTEGRFAWRLIDVEQLAEPIPAKGQLGLWEFPADVIRIEME